MPNEFQFSFSAADIQKLIDEKCERVIVTGKVIHDAGNGTSTFEIYAEIYESKSNLRIIGCPMPC
ncbi:MAG: hypothetical protein M3Z92_13375 [Bacteroidota bacterium]|nr:hypothetical protein [Bacteroidota bacterium]